MKEKLNLKKLLKLAGNIVVIAALAFVVKKFIDMDVNFSQLSSSSVIAALVISLVVQAGLIIVACFQWLMFTRSFSGKKIPFSAAMPVYTKSNIFKYIPGNVFQYVGRNKLAADMKISHVDVACATVFDVLFCVIWTGVISVILLGSSIAELLEKYGKNILIIGIVGVAAVVLGLILVYYKFREKLKRYLSRYAKAFAPGNRFRLFQGVFYYLVHNSVSAAMYFVCLRLIVGSSASVSELAVLTGAFMFAWIIGFVTPGAPGGIGIRESVMLFVSGDKYEDKVLLFVVAMRLSSVLADVAAFLAGSIYNNIIHKNSKEAS